MTKGRILDGWVITIQWSHLSLLEVKDLRIKNRAAVEITAGWAGLGGPQQPRQYFKIIKIKKKYEENILPLFQI